MTRRNKAQRNDWTPVFWPCSGSDDKWAWKEGWGRESAKGPDLMKQEGFFFFVVEIFLSIPLSLELGCSFPPAWEVLLAWEGLWPASGKKEREGQSDLSCFCFCLHLLQLQISVCQGGRVGWAHPEPKQEKIKNHSITKILPSFYFL